MSGIASITIILVAVHQGYYPVATMTAALAGGIFGFIHYNFNPATIFMGDTGSMFIGYMLASIAIFGAVKSAATIALIVPAVALGLPIMDTAFAILPEAGRAADVCHQYHPESGSLRAGDGQYLYRLRRDRVDCDRRSCWREEDRDFTEPVSEEHNSKQAFITTTM